MSEVFAAWEERFRDHWPHHYRDVLDKMQGDLPFVAVSDSQVTLHGQQNPLVTLEKTFRAPLCYRMRVQDPAGRVTLEERVYELGDLESCVVEFVSVLGGWLDKPRA